MEFQEAPHLLNRTVSLRGVFICAEFATPTLQYHLTNGISEDDPFVKPYCNFLRIPNMSPMSRRRNYSTPYPTEFPNATGRIKNYRPIPPNRETRGTPSPRYRGRATIRPRYKGGRNKREGAAPTKDLGERRRIDRGTAGDRT